ncbi:MAG: hypothetical protein WBW44_00665, partial [Solirubrobacterales bacterium]
MRTFAIPATVMTVLAGLLFAGCGETEKDTPVDCFVSAASFSSSLRQAPEEVLLGGKVPISDCLVRGQSDGDLLRFGQVTIKVGTEKGAAIS